MRIKVASMARLVRVMLEPRMIPSEDEEGHASLHWVSLHRQGVESLALGREVTCVAWPEKVSHMNQIRIPVICVSLTTERSVGVDQPVYIIDRHQSSLYLG
jgi:hypothetical protein